MTSWLAAEPYHPQAGATIRRFGMLIQVTPRLRAYQSDMMDQFAGVAAAYLAGRSEMSLDDPQLAPRDHWPCSACGASSSRACRRPGRHPAHPNRSTRR